MSKIMTVEDAARLIQDGDTITYSTNGAVLSPEAVLEAVETRFLAEGHPRNLTYFGPGFTTPASGKEYLACEGLLKRVITPLIGGDLSPDHARLALDNKVEAYTLPLGVAGQLLVEIAKKSPGLVTKVGLYSYVDPRLGGGKYNEVTKEDLIEVVELAGEEWLLYKTFPINVAIIRGTTADEDGNISLEEEPLTKSIPYQAMAAKNWGGKVIAQVKRVVPSGSIDPRIVLVPGVWVDAIVVAENQWQHERFPGLYDPAIDGRERVSPPPAPLYPLDADKVIARRAAMELEVGQIINLGGGIANRKLAPLTLEEDIQDLMIMSREHGTLGGISYGRDVHVNPTSWLAYQDLFNWYQGGGLDLAMLGFGEVDEEGNTNLTRFGGTTSVGPGGAPDLAYLAKKVVFVGTFAHGGLQVEVGGGKLSIVREGKGSKFVKQVYEITISGKYMREQHKPMLFITERAVFQLTEAGLELIEIASGVDLKKDVLGQMGFQPLVSNSLRQMAPRIFTDGLMGLRRDMLGYEEKGRKPPVPMIPVSELPARSYWTMRLGVK